MRIKLQDIINELNWDVDSAVVDDFSKLAKNVTDSKGFINTQDSEFQLLLRDFMESHKSDYQYDLIKDVLERYYDKSYDLQESSDKIKESDQDNICTKIESVTTPMGEYEVEELAAMENEMKDAFKDYWKGDISVLDLEATKQKLRQHLTDAQIQNCRADANIEYNKVQESKKIETIDNSNHIIVINPQDSEYYDNLYLVSLDLGVQGQYISYKVYADYEEQALEIVISYVEDKAPYVLTSFMEMDPYEAEDEGYTYVDATEYGAKEPYYILNTFMIKPTTLTESVLKEEVTDIDNEVNNRLEEPSQSSTNTEDEEDSSENTTILDDLQDRIGQKMTVGELNTILQSLFGQYNKIFLLVSDLYNQDPDELQELVVWDDNDMYTLTYKITNIMKDEIALTDVVVE